MLALALTLGACSEDFIQVEPKGSFLEDNYYKNEEEAYTGLVAAYDVIRKHSGGFENTMSMLNAASDDFYAGGGSSTDGAGIQGISNYTINPTTIPQSFWADFYKGIFRANVLIEKLPGVPGMGDADKARFTAECKALRAYYYFNIVSLFGDAPLYTTNLSTSQFYSIQKSPAADIYTQVEKDLLEAIDALPPTLNMATEAGRFTKGAALALLGKVYLFQGKKTEAAAKLAEVNGTPGQTSPYGYKLLTNFADLWLTDNKFNTESIFECAHTNKSLAGWGNWGGDNDEGNSLNVMVGPRGYLAATAAAPKYRTGWSFNPVTLDLFNAMQGDPRLSSTIENLGALKASGVVDYSPGYMDTGLFLKKFMPKDTDVSSEGGEVVLNYRQNTYIIRLADTYLMEAEALNGTGPRAQALLDAVRARVGLPSITVSMDAVMKERRLELAGEGHRWHDLIRTGQATAKLSSRGFVAGKHEHWPVPIKETENTQVTQNPAYN